MDRALTTREREVLDWMLAQDFPDAASFRAQASALRVRGICECGCPTINFVADAPFGSPLPIYAFAAYPPADIILFELDGSITSLEYVNHTGSSPSEFPPPDEITPASA